MEAAVAAVGILGTFIVVDAAWLTYRYDYHRALFASIQKSPLSIRWIAAAAVYVILGIAVFVWAVRDAHNVRDAALRGAGVGLLMYAFYDLTNYSTLTNYTLSMTLVDAAWGAILCAAAATVGYLFYTG